METIAMNFRRLSASTVFGFVAVLALLLLALGYAGESVSPIYTVLHAASPAIAVGLTLLIFRVGTYSLGLQLRSFKYILFAFSIPLAITALVYLLAWAFTDAQFSAIQFSENVYRLIPMLSGPMVFGISIPMMLVYGLIVCGLMSLGEELGWSGLLIPQLLKRFSYTNTALISGFVWMAFHLPLFLIFCFHDNSPMWNKLLFFAVTLMSFSFIRVFLVVKTKSIWPSVMLHTSHSMFLIYIFGNMTIEGQQSAYLLTQCGAGIAATYLLVATFTWRKLKRIEI